MDALHDPLEDLISRMQGTVQNPDEKPLWLHWSDVTLLRSIARERRERAQRVEALRGTIGALLDDAFRAQDGTSPFKVRCESCAGTGKADYAGFGMDRCGVCRGTGSIVIQHDDGHPIRMPSAI